MSGPAPVRDLGAPAPRDDRAALRRASQALEGVFLSRLMQAMRSSVPQSGLLDADPGRETFESLLDDRLANLAAERMKGGPGDALYRQLEKKLGPEPGGSKPAASGGAELVRPVSPAATRAPEPVRAETRLSTIAAAMRKAAR